MKKKSSNFLFNFISPIYGLFYNSQKKNYRKNLALLRTHISLSNFNSVIDVGCGTGAMCSALKETFCEVTGVDPALRMLQIGMKKKENKDITFIECQTCHSMPFNDKSFDISIASYVAHGLKKDERQILYNEMSRLSKEYVLFFDYNERRSILTNIVEWAEGGDYFNFIKTVGTELENAFESVMEIKLDKRASWYICKPKK